MDSSERQARARRTSAAWTAPLVYGAIRGLARVLLWPYFRTRSVGREHIPSDGPEGRRAGRRLHLNPQNCIPNPPAVVLC